VRATRERAHSAMTARKRQCGRSFGNACELRAAGPVGLHHPEPLVKAAELDQISKLPRKSADTEWAGPVTTQPFERA